MIAGRKSRYRGTQGTSICQIFEGVIGQTGASEKLLTQLGDTDFEKVYLYVNSHAGYYPNAKMMAIKVLFRKSDGRLLGAQVLGEDGVPKRVDAFAMAIQMKATIYDLEEAELCYAPPFGSAKDPVNFAGMVAGNLLRGDMPLAHWDGVEQAFLLDVRNPPELEVESVPGALNIPLPQLRARLGELPRDKEIHVICRSGGRAYLRDAHPAPERLQGPQHLGRHAGPLAPRHELKRLAEGVTNMKAITVEPGKPGSARFEDVPEPDPREGSVLVEAVAVGVCGTDVEIAEGKYGWAPPGHARLVLGHESLGRVVDPGPTSGLKKGDLVVGIVRRPDPVPCPNCAVGEWDMCRNGQYTERGIKEIHGFMSERWRVEPEYAIKVDPSLGLLGVLLEPTTVIVKALEQVVAVGQRVLLGAEDGARDRRGSDRPPGGLRRQACAGMEVHVLDRVEARAEAGPRARPRRDVPLGERPRPRLRAGRHRRVHRRRVGARGRGPEDRGGRHPLPDGSRRRRRAPPATPWPTSPRSWS